jgi:hypothetical protein
MYDESWYGSVAYNFSLGKGLFNTIIGSGGNANFMLAIVTALFYKIFGVSLFAIRMVPVMSGLLFLIVLRKIFQLLKLSDIPQLIGFLSVLCIPFFNTLFRVGRPECLGLLFILIGIYFYLKFITQEKKFYVLWSAVFLSFAVFSHPFALLFFLLLGIHLLYFGIINKNYKTFIYLFIFGVIGVVSFFILLLAHGYYNNNHSIDLLASYKDISSRASLENSSPETIFDRIKAFLDVWVFSLKIIFSLPLLILSCYACFLKNNIIRFFSFMSLGYFFISFFLFKNDLSMFPLIFDYFIVLIIPVIPFVFERLNEKNRKISTIVFAVFFLVNFSASQLFNIQKREKINTVLQTDLKSILPCQSKVFGPLRFWPFSVHTDYISDHYRLEFPKMEEFDYVITNSQDEKIYPTYSYFQKKKELFELIYSKDSKQYGVIEVYKRKIDLKVEK